MDRLYNEFYERGYINITIMMKVESLAIKVMKRLLLVLSHILFHPRASSI